MVATTMALARETAKLPVVEIVKPKQLIGKTTVECIQSGLYFENLAAIREIARLIKQDCFKSSEALVIGTGGFSRLFEDAGVFDVLIPDLVLQGLRLAFRANMV